GREVGSRNAVDEALIIATRASTGADSREIATALDAMLGIDIPVSDSASATWAEELTHTLVARLVPELSSHRPAVWDLLTDRIARHARALGDFDGLRRLEHLAAERARGVRIAIVGEFNAGKSTFVNALLGMDVAPTGILPTTAVAHVLRYGPDPIARA